MPVVKIRADRLLYTIPEAMELLNVSNRTAFVNNFIYTGRIGVYPEPSSGRLFVPKCEIVTVLDERENFPQFIGRLPSRHPNSY